MTNNANPEDSFDQVSEERISHEQIERFDRMKHRLMKRGFSEADAEEEAASWVKMNRIFDAEPPTRVTA